MADLSDVTAFIKGLVLSAVYPNGTSQPSAAAVDVRIFEGWPVAEQLDLDMAGMTVVNGVKVPRTNGPLANVSVFPMPGSGPSTGQVLDTTGVVIPPALGMQVTTPGGVITVSGQPNAGEFLTVVADRQFAYSSNASTAAAILAALATQAQANYPSASSTATTLTIPARYSLVVRQGGVGTLGRKVGRQKHDVMVTAWAPTHVIRNALCKAIDPLIKSNVRVTMPDTTQAVICFSRTNTSDEEQVKSIYRRDMIYTVQYDTIATFPGTTITTVSVQETVVSGAGSSPVSNAIV